MSAPAPPRTTIRAPVRSRPCARVQPPRSRSGAASWTWVGGKRVASARWRSPPWHCTAQRSGAARYRFRRRPVSVLGLYPKAVTVRKRIGSPSRRGCGHAGLRGAVRGFRKVVPAFQWGTACWWTCAPTGARAVRHRPASSGGSGGGGALTSPTTAPRPPRPRTRGSPCCRSPGCTPTSRPRRTEGGWNVRGAVQVDDGQRPVGVGEGPGVGERDQRGALPGGTSAGTWPGPRCSKARSSTTSASNG